jgi:phosphoribosyl 1,2-cyclic phosphate phosphodiesterase
MSQRLRAGRTFLTHIAHKNSHAEIDARLPDGVSAAFDGLEVDIG